MLITLHTQRSACSERVMILILICLLTKLIFEQTKIQHFILHSCCTQCNACNDRLNLISNLFTTDNGMRTGFNLSLCMALCFIGCQICSKYKRNVVLLFGFSPVAILASYNRMRNRISLFWFLTLTILYSTSENDCPIIYTHVVK